MRKVKWALLVVSALALGCGQSATPDKQNEAKKQAGGSNEKLFLTEEPSGAKGVIEVKKQVKDGDEVVVVGRIGGSRKPFTGGRASFTIVDPSLPPCSDDEGCAFPWDYCCEDSDDLKKATVLVKFLDENGKTLAQDAKETMGLKELQTVVVRGIARRDGDSSISVVASGLFIKK